MLPYYQLVSIPEVGVIFLQILARTFWIFISRHFYSTAAFKLKWSETQPSIFRSYFIQFDQNHIATQKYNQIDVKLKPNPVSIRKNMRWRVGFTQFVVQNCTFYPHGVYIDFIACLVGFISALKGMKIYWVVYEIWKLTLLFWLLFLPLQVSLLFRTQEDMLTNLIRTWNYSMEISEFQINVLVHLSAASFYSASKAVTWTFYLVWEINETNN